MYQMHAIQENVDILGDGYQGDVLGESTPDVLVTEFVCFFLSNFLLNVYVVHIHKFTDRHAFHFHMHITCYITNRYL